MVNKNAVIVAFGFGEPPNLKPNRRIAGHAAEIAQTIDAAFIATDRDVSPHLSESVVEVRYLNPTLFPNTYRLAMFAVEQAKGFGTDTLYVVAAPCHIWRCVRDLRWAAKDQGVTIKLVSQLITGSPYDLAATTLSTRSMWIWWPLEIMYRIVSTLRPRWYKRTRA